MTSDKVSRAIAARLGPNSSSTQARKGSFWSNGRVVSTGVAALDDVKTFPVRLGHLVDVVGSSLAGKTQLLHLIAARALTCGPKSSRVRVCWFDLNGGLDPNRIAQLVTRFPGRDDANTTNVERLAEVASGLQVYRPESTVALCASLQEIPDFLQTPEGKEVDTLIIDSLGCFHYIDKYDADHAKETSEGRARPLSSELVLARVLAAVLQDRKVVAFVSKCALFGDEALKPSWPFPESGIPRIPVDFMPSLWASIVSHTILLYEIQASSSSANLCSNRAIVSIIHRHQSISSKSNISAAGTLLLSRGGIDETEVHIV